MKHSTRHIIDTDIALLKLARCKPQPIDRLEFEPFVCPSRRDRDGCLAVCEGLIDILSALFNVSGGELRSAKRSGKASDRVRQIGIYVAHVSLGLDMGMVANAFCRSKSTVVHSCRVIEDLRDDDEFDQIITRVERIVLVAFGNLRGNG